MHGLLAAAAAHAHAVDHVSLLGLEAHAAGLVRPGGPGQAHNAGQLPELPAAHAQQEAEHLQVAAGTQGAVSGAKQVAAVSISGTSATAR